MDFEWIEDQKGLDWSDLVQLYKAAPLGDRSAQHLQLSFSNSMFSVFVYFDDHLIGAGRVLADGVDSAYICDVAVHPAFQGKGLGTQIVSRLIAQSSGHRKILLYSIPGKEHFYRKLGFRRMTTAMAIFNDPVSAEERGLIGPE